MKKTELNELLQVADDMASDGYGIPAYRIIRVLLQIAFDGVEDDTHDIFCSKYNGQSYVNLVKNYRNEFNTSLRESKDMVDNLIERGRLTKL